MSNRRPLNPDALGAAGADEKHEADHGGEYTPNTAIIRTFYTSETNGYPIPGRAAQFNRWLETVRAEAKAEALNEAASAYPVMLRDMVSRTSVAAWLRNRADECRKAS